MNDFAELAFMETPLIDAVGFMELILRFVLNMVVVVAIIRFFYYPKSRRRDYFFTFTLISISIFLMIFLLGSVKLKIISQFLRQKFLTIFVNYAKISPCVGQARPERPGLSQTVPKALYSEVFLGK